MMYFVGIEGNRNCYSPDQKKSCTVGDLIDYLNQFDEDLPVYLVNDNGYTFGTIDYYDVNEHTINEDGELDVEDSDLDESHKINRNKLYIRDSKELLEGEVDVMDLFSNIDSKDIDHHATDLYVRKTPETTKIIKSLPDTYKSNVTTFRDQIDFDTWYEVPFAYHK